MITNPKGIRTILPAQAKIRREILNAMIAVAEEYGFQEITLPIVEYQELYVDKAGSEILSQMYTFHDKKGLDICLRPEGTATLQQLAKHTWKYDKDIKLWYFTPCWRYEQPQAGRYREFYQFGVEHLNPTEDPTPILIEMAEKLVSLVTDDFITNISVKRGLSYYTNSGFEISCDSLGAQKQVVGGGPYAEGVGFAVGFDRLCLLHKDYV